MRSNYQNIYKTEAGQPREPGQSTRKPRLLENSLKVCNIIHKKYGNTASVPSLPSQPALSNKVFFNTTCLYLNPFLSVLNILSLLSPLHSNKLIFSLINFLSNKHPFPHKTPSLMTLVLITCSLISFLPDKTTF